MEVEFATQPTDLIPLIKVLIRGSDASEIKGAEDFLMKIQTGPHWKNAILYYLELIQSEDADVGLVAFIQLKYIFKQNIAQIDREERHKLLMILFRLKDKVTLPCVQTYCTAMAHILFQELEDGNIDFVAKAVAKLLSGLKVLLEQLLNESQNNFLLIQLSMVVALESMINDEMSYMQDSHKANCQKYQAAILGSVESATKVYSAFLCDILDNVGQLSPDFKSKILEASYYFFKISEYTIQNTSQPSNLQTNVQQFAEKVPTALSSCQNEESFDSMVEPSAGLPQEQLRLPGHEPQLPAAHGFLAGGRQAAHHQPRNLLDRSPVHQPRRLDLPHKGLYQENCKAIFQSNGNLLVAHRTKTCGSDLGTTARTASPRPATSSRNKIWTEHQPMASSSSWTLAPAAKSTKVLPIVDSSDRDPTQVRDEEWIVKKFVDDAGPQYFVFKGGLEELRADPRYHMRCPPSQKKTTAKQLQPKSDHKFGTTS